MYAFFIFLQLPYIPLTVPTLHAYHERVFPVGDFPWLMRETEVIAGSSFHTFASSWC